MLRNLSILIAFSAVFVNSIRLDSGRIVGGGNAIPGEIPHQVSLRFFGNDFHFAGGALITNRWVVSAANYLSERAQDSINIVVGTTMLNARTNSHRTDRIVVHADYNRTANINNIAVLRSSVIIQMTQLQNIIALGQTLIAPGVTARVSGWGATSADKGPDSNFLQARNVQILACEDTEEFQAQTQHICAEAAVCTTDIGGPLVHNNQLIGIAAWHNPTVCGSNTGQDSYMRISVFRTWILGNID